MRVSYSPAALKSRHGTLDTGTNIMRTRFEDGIGNAVVNLVLHRTIRCPAIRA
jgi:hypothetical protein